MGTQPRRLLDAFLQFLTGQEGDPDDIESRTRYLGHRYGHPQTYGSVVVEEDWIYDFGPRYLYRVVTLTAGRISNVESGRRGH